MIEKLLQLKKNKEDYEYIICSNLIFFTKNVVKTIGILTPDSFAKVDTRFVYEKVLQSLGEDIDVRAEVIASKHSIMPFVDADSYASSIVAVAKKLRDVNHAIQLYEIYYDGMESMSEQTVDEEVQKLSSEISKMYANDSPDPGAIEILKKYEDVQSEYAEKIMQGIDLLGISSGNERVDKLTDGLRGGHFWVVGGYCLGKGTLVKMADGTEKEVEKIVKGEMLAGVDSETDREVVATTVGVDQMYKITGKYVDDFTVNSGHLIPVIHDSTKKVTLMKAEDIAKLNTSHYRIRKHYTDPVDFDIDIDPYFLGYWLGDGTRGTANITCDDKEVEVIEYLKNHAKGIKHNFKIRKDNRNSNVLTLSTTIKNGGDPSLRTHALSCKFPSKKIIPRNYMLASMRTKLDLLAGLIDSDGYVGGAGNTNYVFCQKDFVLTQQVRELAESCGLNTSITTVKQKDSKLVKLSKDSYLNKLTISGDVSKIPVKIPRKKANNKKAPLVENENWVTFNIENIGKGEYYGFELDGNHLFMASNFIVNHNTSTGKTFWALNIVAEMIRKKKKALFFSLEMSQIDIMGRLIGILSGVDSRRIIKGKLDDKELQAVSKAKEQLREAELYIYTDLSSVEEIKIECTRQSMSGAIDLVAVDYLQMMHAHGTSNQFEILERVSKDLQGFALKLNTTIIGLSQVSNEGARNGGSSIMSFKGSGAIAASADVGIELLTNEDSQDTINQKKIDGEPIKIKAMVKKNRHGETGNIYMTFSPRNGRYATDETEYAFDNM